MTKTNAIRIIEKEGVEYKVHTYDGGALSGVEVPQHSVRMWTEYIKLLL